MPAPSTSVLSKALIVAVFLAAVALTALIAALPLNLPSHQGSQAANPASFNNGDTAWMIVATILGLFLAPAVTYMYALIHGNNVGEQLRTVILTSSVITFLWVLFTFSLAYGKDAHKNGIIGLPITYHMFKGTTGETAALDYAWTIPASIFAVYELGFALVTPAIIISSLGGRLNLNGFLLFIFIWHITLYTPVAHIVWGPRGAMNTNWVRDFSGALVVHITGSITAMVLHFVIGKDATAKPSKVANPDQALFAACIVWFLWFAFAAGKAHNASAVAAQSIVNTIAASMTGVVMSFFVNLIMEKPTTSTSLLYGILIPLVAISPASGYVTVGGAMVISTFTYLFTTFFAQIVLGEGLQIDQSYSVISVHAVAGTVGFLGTAILEYQFVNPGGFNGLTAGKGSPLAWHIVALLCLWSTVAVSAAIIAFVSNVIAPIGNGVVTEEYNTVETKPVEGEKTDGAVELTQV